MAASGAILRGVSGRWPAPKDSVCAFMAVSGSSSGSQHGTRQRCGVERVQRAQVLVKHGAGAVLALAAAGRHAEVALQLFHRVQAQLDGLADFTVRYIVADTDNHRYTLSLVDKALELSFRHDCIYTNANHSHYMCYSAPTFSRVQAQIETIRISVYNATIDISGKNVLPERVLAAVLLFAVLLTGPCHDFSASLDQARRPRGGTERHRRAYRAGHRRQRRHRSGAPPDGAGFRAGRKNPPAQARCARRRAAGDQGRQRDVRAAPLRG